MNFILTMLQKAFSEFYALKCLLKQCDNTALLFIFYEVQTGIILMAKSKKEFRK